MMPDIVTLVGVAASTVTQHANQFTQLDQAIGDGDHGINLQRGFAAVLAARDELAELTPGAALEKIGMLLVMNIGGASGPLYGSFFLGFGKALPSQASLVDLAEAFTAGVALVQKRGKAAAGEKTMLDVLLPFSQRLTELAANHAALSRTQLAELSAVAERGLQSTRPLQASKGRAAFLGERSVGHLDPGACSSCTLLTALLAAWPHAE